MARPWRLLVTGGGPGGHLYPALAIAQGAARRYGPVEVLYVGSRYGLEAQVVPRAGVPFEGLPVRGLLRTRPHEALARTLGLGLSLGKAVGILRRFRPDVVVGTGGYAAGPVGAAAVLRRVPLVLQEQNVVPGVTNRLLSRFAAGVAVPSEAARRHFPPGVRLWVTGNPVRAEVLGISRDEGRRRLGLPAQGPVVVMYAGSVGSPVFVRLLEEMAPLWPAGVTLLFGSGRRYYETALRAAGGRALVRPYIDAMGEALAACDLVVCRAGAMTLAEVTAVGRAAILIPSPYVTHRHQDANAEVLERAGAAVVLPERGLTGRELLRHVQAILGDPARRQAMESASAGIGRPRALDELLERVREVAARAGGSRGG